MSLNIQDCNRFFVDFLSEKHQDISRSLIENLVKGEVPKLKTKRKKEVGGSRGCAANHSNQLRRNFHQNPITKNEGDGPTRLFHPFETSRNKHSACNGRTEERNRRRADLDGVLVPQPACVIGMTRS